MIPRIIHQTAKSKDLTPEEQRLGVRLRALLPRWDYRLWDDSDNVKMVREHFPQYFDSFQSIKRGVVRADIARYMYLCAFGGFYFDTDYKLVKTIDDALLSAACVLPISRETTADPRTFRVGNAVMGSEPGFPLLTELLARLFSNHNLLQGLEEQAVEKTTGPEGLTDFLLENEGRYPGLLLVPREVFHPPHRLNGFSYARTPKTVGVHLCWGSWRTKNLPQKVRNLAIRKLTALYD
jgi:mannosyltransferase OCH1-like enzyme